MSQAVSFTTIAERLDALEAVVSGLRNDLAHAIERTREDFEDLNAELENRVRRIYETMDSYDERQSNGLGRLERSLNTDLDRIQYDVSTLESRCGVLEQGGRW